MDCKTARSHLSAYLDNTMDAPTAAAFDQHVGACPTCATHFEAETNVERQMASALASPSMPSDMWSQLRSAVNKDALLQSEDTSANDAIPATVETQRGWILPVSLSAAAAITISVWGFWPVQPKHDYSEFWQTQLASMVAQEPAAGAISDEARIDKMLRDEYGVAMASSPEVTHGHPIKVLFSEPVSFADRKGQRLQVNCCGKPVVIVLLALSESESLPNVVRAVVDEAREQDAMENNYHVGVERVGNYDAIIFSEHELVGMREFLKRVDA